MFAFKVVSCGLNIGIAWLPVNPQGAAARSGGAGPGTPSKAAIDSFYQLSQQIASPPIAVGVAPALDGITGLESYFWLTGYNGAPLDQVTQTAGASIEIRALPSAYSWDFGDGTGVVTTTSLGQAYPAVSDIRHTYEIRSDRSPYAQGGKYLVKVTASFDVSFRVSVPGVTLVNDGWTTFASLGYQPIRSSTQLSYKVDEVRSVLTG